MFKRQTTQRLCSLIVVSMIGQVLLGPQLLTGLTPNDAAGSSREIAIVVQPVKIKIRYGETMLPTGMKLPVVSKEGNSVQVEFMGEVQTIPVSAVRFEPVNSNAEPASTNRAIQEIAAPPPPAERKIVLRPFYDSRMQGGDITMRELQSLLSSHCAAGVNLSGAGIDIYNGVRYLMDAREAADVLGLHGIPSRVQLATPGFPRSSMYYLAYDGSFEGHFNRIYLVTDAANQVTAVQLVDERPRSGCHFPRNENWTTYNFINTRLRASKALRAHDESKREGDRIRIETSLCQQNRREWTEIENTKLLLPVPFAQIVLHCIQTGSSQPLDR